MIEMLENLAGKRSYSEVIERLSGINIMQDRLKNLPISFFSSVMGLCGLAIALQKADILFADDHWLSVSSVGDAVGFLGITVFIALTVVYVMKLIHYPEMVSAELSHPVKMSFGASITVSLLLLSITTLHLAPAVSEVLLVAGAVMHLMYTMYALNSWIHKTHYEIKHISPAWFIPVVGNILVPVAGVAHGYTEISWFYFSVGLLFWLVLFTIIIYRMIFHHPLPDKLLPTLFIMIAPPAVGFISYVKLTGGLDGFGRMLYFSALFMTLLLLMQIPRFVRLPFYLSWWAYSFPLAAMSISTLLMFDLSQSPVYAILAWSLMVLLFVVVAYLVTRTCFAISDHQICVEEH